MNVDPRGQRFNAALSAIVLVVVLITSSAWLLGAQAVVFGIGAVFGLRYAPYGLIYRWLVRPRLGPPGELEDEAPPRFSQGVGLVISVIGVIGYAAGLIPLGMAAAAARARRGVPQRSLRLLPGLRDVCADQTSLARPAGDGRAGAPTRRLLHEPLRRPGGRGLGGGPPG